MTQQRLNDPDIGVCLQQMRGEAVAQSVQGRGLRDPRHVFGCHEGPVQLPGRQGRNLWLARKQPAFGSRLAPILTEHLKQAWGQHGLPVLAALTPVDMDQHSLAIDVATLSCRPRRPVTLRHS